jgi:hypothetical protein
MGHTWNPILGWSRADVIDYVRSRGDRLHEAYTTEARLIANVRRRVAEAVGLVVMHTDEAAVLARYAQLLSGAPSR